MIIFEPPQALGGSGLPVWCGVSGGANWGGCDVWISQDNATYEKIGRITQGARWGKLFAALATSATTIDQTNTLAVDLTQSGGQLLSAGANGAAALTTLSWVGGELLAYGTAALTATSKYNLTYLSRGAYGTPISAHPAGTPFLRLDQAVFQYATTPAFIGKTIYLKFVSFNQFGNYGNQSLASVQPVAYTVTGAGISQPPSGVSNLLATLTNAGAALQWSGVSDTRPLDYEIRQGASWAQGLLAGHTTGTFYSVSSAGTYWVASRAQPVAGYSVYQASPASAVVAQASLPRSIIASTDLAAAGFPGTLTGSACRVTAPGAAALLELGGTANILAEASLLTVGDVLFDGGVGGGIYTLAGSTNLGRVQAAQITLNVTAGAMSIYNNYLSIPGLLAATDVLAANTGGAASVQPQISIAQANGVYGAWVNFSQGQVTAQYIQARLLLNTASAQVTMQVTGLTLTVDVGGTTQSASAVAVPAAGLAITFPTAFSAVPAITANIIGGAAGDTLTLAAQSATGFSVQALNALTPVSRSIDWIAYGI